MQRPHPAFVYVTGALVCALFASAAYRYLMLPDPNVENFAEGFELKLLDYAGNDVHLSDYRRTLLVVYAWASWCPYCGGELRDIARIAERHAGAVTVLAVNRGESRTEAQTFSDSLGIGTITFLLDPDDAFFRSIGGYAMPEIAFINKKGEIVHHQRGPLSVSEFEQRVNDLVAGGW